MLGIMISPTAPIVAVAGEGTEVGEGEGEEEGTLVDSMVGTGVPVFTEISAEGSAELEVETVWGGTSTASGCPVQARTESNTDNTMAGISCLMIRVICFPKDQNDY